MFSAIKLAYYKLFEKEILCTAYHEAGHGIVASLFSNNIYLNTLTINKKALEGRGYNGVLHMEFITVPPATDYLSGDNLTLIALAGTCSRTLFTKGTQFVKSNLLNFKHRVSLLDTTGAEIDWTRANSESTRTKNYTNIPLAQINMSGVNWVFCYLMMPVVWDATRKLAEELIRRPNLTLNRKQIEDFLSDIGFTDYLAVNGSTILAKRYPLNAHTVNHLLTHGAC